MKEALKKIEDQARTAFSEYFPDPFCWQCEMDCDISKAYDDMIAKRKEAEFLRKFPYLHMTDDDRRRLLSQRIGSSIAESLDLKRQLAPVALGYDFTDGKGYRLHGNNRIGKTYALSATAFSWPNTAWKYSTTLALVEYLTRRDWDDRGREVAIAEKCESMINWKRPKEQGRPLFLLDDFNGGLTEIQWTALAAFIDWLILSRSVVLCVASNLQKEQIINLCKGSNEAKRAWTRITEMTEKI